MTQQSAAPAVFLQRHAPEAAAIDVRDAVMLRQPFVDERVVRAQQVEHAAILAQDALEKQLGLRRKACRRLSSKSGNRRMSGVIESRLRRCSHCDAKLRTSALRPGSASMRRTFSFQHRRLVERPVAARSNSSSGMLLQRKKRDASSRSLTR